MRDHIHRELCHCGRDLVSCRRRRAATERWKIFAQKCGYHCPETECKSKVAFNDWGKLRGHSLYMRRPISHVNVLNQRNFSYACLLDIANRRYLEGIHVSENEGTFTSDIENEREVKHPEFVVLNL